MLGGLGGMLALEEAVDTGGVGAGRRGGAGVRCFSAAVNRRNK